MKLIDVRAFAILFALLAACSAGEGDTNAGGGTGGTASAEEGKPSISSGGAQSSGGSASPMGTTGGANATTGGGMAGASAGRAGDTQSNGAPPDAGSAGHGGSTFMRGDAGASLKCTAPGGAKVDLPAGAPALQPGVWKDITPPGIAKGSPQTMIAQGITIDPCNMSVLYWGNTPFMSDTYGAVWKSTDAGATWKILGNKAAAQQYQPTTTFLDKVLHVRVDPRNPAHLYAGQGVGGKYLGFWISNDGGENWAKTDGWLATSKSVGFIDDIYDVAVDPTDFDHVLVSSHAAWAFGSAKYGTDAGVLESKDGGKTWIVHDPITGWGYGHAINFLYAPELGIGDSQTWLLGTQGDGQWRTTDGGKTWNQVIKSDIFHGGADIYYAKNGVLYTTGYKPCLLSSKDNGATWETAANLSDGCTGLIGDGNLLYTAPSYAQGIQPVFVSPETDGHNWTKYKGGAQTWNDGGPYEMAFDPVNRIIYSSNWFQGVWALKVDGN
jgi:photosystem II stability/assembly factor-like uncharacterized protein